MIGVAVAAVILSVISPAAASAQVKPPEDRISAALARARQVGTPVALLESKIAEGRAKGVSPDRIASAIERRQAALERARQALGDDAPSNLGVGADAIESGVSETVLEAIAANAPRERRAVAIAVLTDLVNQGHTPEAALGRVRDALKRGPDALSNLPAEAGGRRGDGPGRGGQGRGNAGGRAGAESGPPSGVPAPGKPSQAGRPESGARGRGPR